MNTRSKKSQNPMPAVAGIHSPPDATTIPAAPVGYIPRPKGSRRERKPMATQKRAALEAAHEIATSSTYVAEFGASAPDQSDFGSALGVAGGWSVAISQESDWIRFARDQEKDAWKHAYPILDAMQPVFEAALARRPELGAKYASLARYYSIGRERGRASARGRALKKAGDEKSADASHAANDANPSPSSPVTTPVAHETVAAVSSTPEAHRAA